MLFLLTLYDLVKKQPRLSLSLVTTLNVRTFCHIIHARPGPLSLVGQQVFTASVFQHTWVRIKGSNSFWRSAQWLMNLSKVCWSREHLQGSGACATKQSSPTVDNNRLSVCEREIVLQFTRLISLWQTWKKSGFPHFLFASPLSLPTAFSPLCGFIPLPFPLLSPPSGTLQISVKQKCDGIQRLP